MLDTQTLFRRINEIQPVYWAIADEEAFCSLKCALFRCHKYSTETSDSQLNQFCSLIKWLTLKFHLDWGTLKANRTSKQRDQKIIVKKYLKIIAKKTNPCGVWCVPLNRDSF